MALGCEQLTFRYHAKSDPTLDRVSLSFDAPVTAIIGPNGVGKSTLLRLLGGLEDRGHKSGRVLLDGEDVFRLSPASRVRRIAYLSQTPRMSAPLTVRETVALGRVHLPRNEAAIDEALHAIDLLGRSADRFNDLSVGQRQLAAFARTLAQLADSSPDTEQYLLADEPVASLDPRHAIRLVRLIRKRAEEGMRCVMVVHDIEFAAEVADRVVCLGESGGILADGPTAEVLTADRLEKVFGCRFRTAGAGPRPDYAT